VPAEDIAPRVLELIEGAMDELVIGDPANAATDVGPVIDEDARRRARSVTSTRCTRRRRSVTARDWPAACAHGTFVAPTLIVVGSLARMKREVFGPILHVVTFRAGQIDALTDAINGLGYGAHARHPQPHRMRPSIESSAARAWVIFTSTAI